MTSRRKQIKPIKALSDILPGTGDFGVLEVSESRPSMNHYAETDVDATMEENIEPTIINKVSTLNSIDTEVEGEKIKTMENPDSNPSPIDISEDLSKKNQKDDAKILPFDTSGGVDIFQCPLCDQSSIYGRENLTSHLQEHQNKTKREDGKHLCCLCYKELSSNSSLERHLLTHSNHRPFSCVLCDKKFTTNGNLSRHVKTSHNNNENIESSIDEVLKKHHIETTSSNVATKINISHKHSKKTPLNSDMNENVMTYMGHPKSERNTSQLDPQGSGSSNINLLSPFYSFNVSDFGFISANLNQSSLSITPNATDNESLERRKIDNYPRRRNVQSLRPCRILTSRSYRSKINLCIRNVNHLKKFIYSTNSVQCVKCHRKILLSTNIMSHIRYCYKSHSKADLFCPFHICGKKFVQLRRLLKHIKHAHLEVFSQSLEPVSPALEPLNLSIKGQLSNQPFNKSISASEYSNTQYSWCTPSCPVTCDSILNLSGSNSLGVIPNSTDIAIHFPSFQNINQFISTPTIVTLSPFQFSTPLTSSSSSILGKPSSVPMVISTATSKSSRQSLCSDKVSQNSSSLNLSKSSNDGDFGASNSVSSSLSSRYMTEIKKKNSYKDAPKLITCPMDGCVQKFPWNSSLMRHILTHTAHKPFKCTRCIKSFSTKSNRERHMTRVHRVRINRSKFKSIQASRTTMEDTSKTVDDGVDSDNGADVVQDVDLKIIELSEEEWIIMDDNDRRAEDISSNLLKLAGQPIVEPNPVRLQSMERKIESSSFDSTLHRVGSLVDDTFHYQDNCI